MANYKRGKCRYQGRKMRAATAKSTFRKKLGLKPIRVPRWPDRDPNIDYWPSIWGWIWTGNWPAAWDIIQHTRPRRAAEKRLENKIIRGVIDVEDIAWPLEKKPHIYYW